MSYVGYIPLVKKYFEIIPSDHTISVLEIGVDRGTTFIPIVAWLARYREKFVAVGIDVLPQESVALTLLNLDCQGDQLVYYLEKNSLEFLPEMVERKAKFDVILLDGDHNYHTVLNEMKYLEPLLHEHSIVVIDDYNGRWSERDMWYFSRAGYENVNIATQPVSTEKHGVKAAVDEWLQNHPGWKKSQPIPGEPILLTCNATYHLQDTGV